MILIIVQEHQESQWLAAVLSHLGAIIIGSLLTKSRIISKEALPEPTIIPALSVVVGRCQYLEWHFSGAALTKNLR
jgi:hypothetical protein